MWKTQRYISNAYVHVGDWLCDSYLLATDAYDCIICMLTQPHIFSCSSVDICSYCTYICACTYRDAHTFIHIRTYLRIQLCTNMYKYNQIYESYRIILYPHRCTSLYSLFPRIEILVSPWIVTGIPFTMVKPGAPVTSSTFEGWLSVVIVTMGPHHGRHPPEGLETVHL